MIPYVEEQFTSEEQDVLRRYFTNLDKPVFALVNLPEVVKGALFARYSRSSKSLRRLFLDEFVGDLDISGDAEVDATVGLARANELYEKVFGEYGDDSVAQLGGVHLACEQASNVLTKVLERGRMMAYLEQSTRYIAYDTRMTSGHYRYYRDPALLDSPFGARYVGDMDRMFDAYGELLPKMQAWLTKEYPQQPQDSDFAYRRAIKAKALDALRGLLPAGALSNVGIYGSGQAYELLLIRMRVHPLPEVRVYADLMLCELRKVIPSFLQRVDRPDRGGAWGEYFERNRVAMGSITATRTALESRGSSGSATGPSGISGDSVTGQAPSVELLDWDPDGESKVLAAACFEYGSESESELLSRVQALTEDHRREIFAAYVGERSNRRHKPGRAFERTDYKFEVVSDYGAFRDLQRHRMLTIAWQDLRTDLGWEMPESVAEAGLGEAYSASINRSESLARDLSDSFPDQAAYGVALAFRIRYTMQMNAREAMHLIELRSGEQGHPTYRRIAQQMHRLIADRAGHHALASAMVFVDHEDHDLERLGSEQRIEDRRNVSAPASTTL